MDCEDQEAIHGDDEGATVVAPASSGGGVKVVRPPPPSKGLSTEVEAVDRLGDGVLFVTAKVKQGRSPSGRWESSSAATATGNVMTSPRGGGGGGGVASPVGLSRQVKPAATPLPPTKTAVVIGAGVAGLKAAIDLQCRGYTVTIIEARERVGGRCCAAPLVPYNKKKTHHPSKSSNHHPHQQQQPPPRRSRQQHQQPSPPKATTTITTTAAANGGGDGSTEYTPAMVDSGASFIHGIVNNPLTELCEDQRFELFEPRGAVDTPIFDFDGRPHSQEKADRMQGVWDGCLDESKQFVRRVARDLGIKVHDAKVVSEGVSLGEVVHEILDKRRLDAQERRLLDFHRSNMEFANAANLHSLSHSLWDQGDKYAFTGAHTLIKEGFSALCQALKLQLDDDRFRLSTVVTKIEYHQQKQQQPPPSPSAPSPSSSSSSCCRVWTEKGEVFTCDQVLVTVPLGILQSGAITFHPLLPSHKQDAIHRLGYGSMNKIFVEFPEPFWRRHPALNNGGATTTTSGGSSSSSSESSDESCGDTTTSTTSGHHHHHGDGGDGGDGPSSYFGFTDDRCPGRFYLSIDLMDVHEGRPILMAFLQANHAQAAESRSDEATLHLYLRILRRIFGESSVPEPVAYLVTKWGRDPYSRGSYTYVPPGGQEGDMAVVAEPVGDQVFFAGEHTSTKHPATVHGAYLSGQEAADKMDGVLRGRDRRQSLRASLSPPPPSFSSSVSSSSSSLSHGGGGDEDVVKKKKKGSGEGGDPLAAAAAAAAAAATAGGGGGKRRRLRSQMTASPLVAVASISATQASASWSAAVLREQREQRSS